MFDPRRSDCAPCPIASGLYGDATTSVRCPAIEELEPVEVIRTSRAPDLARQLQFVPTEN